MPDFATVHRELKRKSVTLFLLFGKKSSMTFTDEEGEQEKDELTYNRQDFWASTSNKQLNFVQHIRTMLKTTGRACRADHREPGSWAC